MGGDEIGEEAILLSGGPIHKRPTASAAAPADAPQAQPVPPAPAPAASSMPEAYAPAAAPAPAADHSTAGMVGKTVAEVERDLIIDTLQHCLGNRTHAANILGISIRTLRNKLKQYSEEGLAVPAPGDGSA